jgi:uncharacterized protein YjeT (DUF2065 family)
VAIIIFDNQKSRALGATVVFVQGLATALFPQFSARFARKMISKNFDNSSELMAKPTYLRRLRAIGVGTMAAAGTGLLFQDVSETDVEPTQTAESATPEKSRWRK